ncbi:MAG: hypothetical protein P8Y54_15350 [Xanthomonadales bacterium]
MLRSAAVITAALVIPLATGPVLNFDPGSAAYAAGDNSGGNGGGNGGGDQSNKPMKGDLYGDVVYLLRDGMGIPIVVNGCIRPLDAYGAVLALNADDTDGNGIEDDDDPGLPEGVGYNRCQDAPQVLMSAGSAPKLLVAEDEDEDELEACDPISNCSEYVVEVELGRLSILRSPPSVVDKALADANNAIENAGQVILDWGGRIAPDFVSLDSPLVNLALMREFINVGSIDSYDPLDMAITGYGKEIAAAFGLGAGDDKEGTGIDPEVTVRVMESSRIGEAYYMLADGEVYWGAPGPMDEPIYLGFDVFLSKPDFDTFTYTRADTFPGNVMYDWYNGMIDDYDRTCESVISAVFVNEPDPGTVTGLEAFALAANDARRVLLFVHDGLIQYVDPVFELTPFSDDDENPDNDIESLTGKPCIAE